ncbi:hypothetical protein BZA05DRAFT_471192, partial [Tricharina praecox]|uniref:uncharacterized protein n=1 Tax=Tricharina praecox TaxID=43433 RepID=UPI0022206008
TFCIPPSFLPRSTKPTSPLKSTTETQIFPHSTARIHRHVDRHSQPQQPQAFALILVLILVCERTEVAVLHEGPRKVCKRRDRPDACAPGGTAGGDWQEERRRG